MSRQLLAGKMCMTQVTQRQKHVSGLGRWNNRRYYHLNIIFSCFSLCFLSFLPQTGKLDNAKTKETDEIQQSWTRSRTSGPAPTFWHGSVAPFLPRQQLLHQFRWLRRLLIHLSRWHHLTPTYQLWVRPLTSSTDQDRGCSEAQRV